MPSKYPRLDDALRYRSSGMSPITVKLTATDRWGLSEKDFRKLDRKMKIKLGLEAATMDTLAELMLVMHQQQQLVDAMSRQLSRDDLPASHYNAQRLLLNDCRETIKTIDIVRKEAGRDKSKHPEKEAERRAQREEDAKINYSCLESNRVQGYFHDSRFGVVQPGNNLLSFEVAVRDIIRMRMLPKSQHEDYIIAEMLDALSEEEKKMNPEYLSKDPVETDLHSWEPERFAGPMPTQYDEYQLLAKRIFLERIQEYNETWRKAEEHVDGLLAAKGLKPGMHFPYIGVPPVIKKAAEGDPEAIAEVKIAISSPDRNERDWGKPWAIDITQKQPLVDPTGMNFGKSLGWIIPVLLAFASAWTCLCLVVGPHNVAQHLAMEHLADEHLVPGSSSRGCALAENQLHPHESSSPTSNYTYNFSTTEDRLFSSADGETNPTPRPPDWKSWGLYKPGFFPAFSSVPSNTG